MFSEWCDKSSKYCAGLPMRRADWRRICMKLEAVRHQPLFGSVAVREVNKARRPVSG